MRGKPEVAVKGTGLISSGEFIRNTYGDAVWRRLERQLSPPARQHFATPLASNWYPLDGLDELWRAFHRTCHDGDPNFPRIMAQMGEFIAHDNLSSIYELLLSFVRTPQQLMRIMPRLWKTYFRGVQVDMGPVGAGHGSFLTRHLGTLNHISPVACGWIHFAFKKIGVEGALVTEQSYDAGHTASDAMTFRVDWSRAAAISGGRSILGSLRGKPSRSQQGSSDQRALGRRTQRA